ncbi:MAG: MFS transporter [bacterium]|nr:MFS transporter [bacterium]
MKDARFAWGFLRARPGLFGLLWIYAGVNFMLSATNVLIIPLVVSFASEAAAGAILSAAGIGAVVGSVLVGIFGVPKKLVASIMFGIFISGFILSIAGVRASLVVIGVAFVLLLLINPIVNAASQTIWQTKVAEGVQGRVFSLRRMIGSAISPLAIFMAGPLTDNVFEPLLAEDGALAGSVGSIIGTGPGRGIGFLYIVAGIGTVGLAVIGWALPRIRNIETELPDEAGRE